MAKAPMVKEADVATMMARIVFHLVLSSERIGNRIIFVS